MSGLLDSAGLDLAMVCAAIGLVYGLLYLVGKRVDRIDPEDRRHRPSRLNEAIAPYVMAAAVIGVVVGLLWAVS
ncbi:MAG: hypothetical protein WD602_08395 [Actinomycetota bacterium]